MDIVANSIMDKEWVYTWNNTTPTGIKAKISDIPDTKNETQDYLENNKEEKGQIIDTKEKMDYKCSAWNVDNSKFELPKNIEFKDTSEIMKDFVQKENGEGVCKACDMAPDEKTKTECKKSLGC